MAIASTRGRTRKPIIHRGSVNAQSLTPAALTTALAGANNDIVYTAKTKGEYGNDITVRYVVSGNNTPLTVSVTGTAITVNSATDGSAAATSTADQVKAAIEASGDAAALVTVADAAANDGSGTIVALAATALTGGARGVTGAAGRGLATRRGR